MAIKLLGLEDTDLLRRVLQHFKGESSTEPGDFLADPGVVVLVAENAGDPVGWLYGYDLPRPDGRHAMLLYEVEVSGEARRCGHGRALVIAFLEEARRRDCSKVWVLADPDNDGAEALYTTTGAQKTPQDMYSWDLG